MVGIQEEARLASGEKRISAVIHELADNTRDVLMVSHGPDIEFAVLELTGKSGYSPPNAQAIVLERASNRVDDSAQFRCMGQFVPA